MKKKYITFITVVLMVVTLLTACGGDTGISDETYTTLKENWTILAELYNQVAADYNAAYSNGQIERDESFENLMNQAAEVLEQLNSTPRDDLTEEKAVEINNTMMRIQEEMAEALGIELVE